MRVFVTGASGWIGTAVVPELLGAGHHVTGLARSDAAAAALADAGVDVQPGSLDDLDLLRSAVGAADGVIHLAFKHDVAFSGDFQAAADADRMAIEAMGEVLAGSDRPLVIASGLLGVAPGRVATERDRPDPATVVVPRLATADGVIAMASRRVRSSVVRLAPTVHGDGDTGFVPALIGIARERGVAGYVGDGHSRWTAVHRSDAARLFRLAVEKAPAGSVLHGSAEEGITIRTIAEAIGRHLDIPTRSIPPEDAAAHFGWIGGFLIPDSPASSTLTQQLLGWKPTGPGLIEDLDAGYYFTRASAAVA
jgi:nucleoside-diphosphate-sugar epimerase